MKTLLVKRSTRRALEGWMQVRSILATCDAWTTIAQNPRATREHQVRAFSNYQLLTPLVAPLCDTLPRDLKALVAPICEAIADMAAALERCEEYDGGDAAGPRVARAHDAAEAWFRERGVRALPAGDEFLRVAFLSIYSLFPDIADLFHREESEAV